VVDETTFFSHEKLSVPRRGTEGSGPTYRSRNRFTGLSVPDGLGACGDLATRPEERPFLARGPESIRQPGHLGLLASQGGHIVKTARLVNGTWPSRAPRSGGRCVFGTICLLCGSVYLSSERQIHRSTQSQIHGSPPSQKAQNAPENGPHVNPS
jgi:hypothetical protein